MISKCIRFYYYNMQLFKHLYSQCNEKAVHKVNVYLISPINLQFLN